MLVRNLRRQFVRSSTNRTAVDVLEPRILLAADFELLKDINALPTMEGSYAADFTAVGSMTFFTATTATYGKELWKTDGTADGTILVKDILPGSYGSNPANLTNFNGTLFFSADDGVHGYELWKSDGTADGTVMINDSIVGNYGSYPDNFAKVDGTLFFQGADASNGRELWKSDGSIDGTVIVKIFRREPIIHCHAISPM